MCETLQSVCFAAIFANLHPQIATEVKDMTYDLRLLPVIQEVNLLMKAVHPTLCCQVLQGLSISKKEFPKWRLFLLKCNAKTNQTTKYCG